MSQVNTRVVVLASGEGTLLQALLDSCAAGRLSAEVCAVVSDQPKAAALGRARDASVAALALPLVGAGRDEWDADLARHVGSFDPDLVVSAGFMKLLGQTFLERFGGQTINTHPSLLPSFPGLHAVRDALKAGVKVTGATVFMVDAGLDTGPILLQEAVEVLPGDDTDSLHERIKTVERRLLVQAVANWNQGDQ